MFWVLKRTILKDLIEMVLLSIHHMFQLRNKKNIFCYILLTKGLSGTSTLRRLQAEVAMDNSFISGANKWRLQGS